MDGEELWDDHDCRRAFWNAARRYERNRLARVRRKGRKASAPTCATCGDRRRIHPDMDPDYTEPCPKCAADWTYDERPGVVAAIYRGPKIEGYLAGMETDDRCVFFTEQYQNSAGKWVLDPAEIARAKRCYKALTGRDPNP